MTLMERFLGGDVSVLCHSLSEMKAFRDMFDPGSRHYKTINGAIGNNTCFDGAEFAIHSGVIGFNPIGIPLSQYRYYHFSESVDFYHLWSEFLLGKAGIPMTFDKPKFYAMLEVG